MLLNGGFILGADENGIYAFQEKKIHSEDFMCAPQNFWETLCAFKTWAENEYSGDIGDDYHGFVHPFGMEEVHAPINNF